MASSTPQAPAQGMEEKAADANDAAEVNMDTSTSSLGDNPDSSANSSSCSSQVPSTEALPNPRSDGSLSEFVLGTSPRISVVDMETGGMNIWCRVRLSGNAHASAWVCLVVAELRVGRHDKQRILPFI